MECENRVTDSIFQTFSTIKMMIITRKKEERELMLLLPKDQSKSRVLLGRLPHLNSKDLTENPHFGSLIEIVICHSQSDANFMETKVTKFECCPGVQ